MPYIVLSDEQIRILTQASGSIELRDSRGLPIARAALLSAEDAEMIASSRRSLAARGELVSSQAVQTHFQKLAEIAQTQELDEAQALALLRQMRAEDAR